MTAGASSVARRKGERSRGSVGPHGEARPDIAQLGQRQETIENDRLIGCHVAHDDFDEEVDVAGNQMAGDHFGHGEKHLDEVILAFGRMAANADSGEDGQAEPDRRAVHDRPVALYRARLLQQLDPSRAGRRGQADPIREHVVWQAGVGLKLSKDFQVDRIKADRISRSGHEIPF